MEPVPAIRFTSRSLLSSPTQLLVIRRWYSSTVIVPAVKRGEVWRRDRYKIDFHVAAESSMFFLFPRAFAFDFDFRCRRPVPRFHPHSRGAESSTPVHVEVPLPGGCCHLQSDLGETASSRWIGRFSAVTRTRLRLDSLTPALQFVLRSFGGEAIERLINLTGHPQARQQHRQLARHRHHSSPFAVLAAARSQLQSPSSQSTVGGQPTQYVMRCLHQ